ncbi:hypothetical protein NHQ30_001617 [Ciborinia camelliae]|nr:hypothetical protein NHQ30_001617 [Ciborinia camelliae]
MKLAGICGSPGSNISDAIHYRLAQNTVETGIWRSIQNFHPFDTTYSTSFPNSDSGSTVDEEDCDQHDRQIYSLHAYTFPMSRLGEGDHAPGHPQRPTDIRSRHHVQTTFGQVSVSGKGLL